MWPAPPAKRRETRRPVTVAVSGDYGKPRPALIVQADAYADHPSLTVLPLTSELIDAPLLRVTVGPGAGTGLRLRSQVMVDKATTIPRLKAGNRIGRLDQTTLHRVSQALAAFLDLE
jgi:mRNA interferase MazF